MDKNSKIDALRHRLMRRGYDKVSITHYYADLYRVEAVEPLSGLRVRRDLKLGEMSQMMNWRAGV